jgi:chemotaxis signal transduction protein
MDAVVVRVDRRRLAVPTARVREVAQVVNVTPVPQALPPIAGLTQVRGQILPVLDLAPSPMRAPRPGDPLLVVELGPVRAALWVDRVDGVETDPADAEAIDLGALFDRVRGARTQPEPA